MDLLEHAAGVWARKVVVVTIALAVAVAVLVWRSSSPDQYVATTTVQVRLPDAQASDPSVQVGYYADTVTGLAASREVREQALRRAGLATAVDDLDDDDLVAEAGTEPGFVEVSATAGTGADAAALADALSEVLSEAVATDQEADLAARRAGITDAIAELGRERREVAAGDNFALAALEREREALLGSMRTAAEAAPWRVAVVEPAGIPGSPEAPRPLRDALLALILALVLAAEGVVVARAWRGSLSARHPDRDAGETAGVPAVVLRDRDGPTALAPLLSVVEPARAVTVVQSGAPSQGHGSVLLARLLDARGDDVLLVDATPDRPTAHRELAVALTPGLTDLETGPDAPSALSGLPRVDGVQVLAAGEPSSGRLADRLTRVLKSAPQSRVVVACSIDRVDDLLPVSVALDGPTVLEVGAGTTRARLRDDVAALRGLGLDVVAVVVRRRSWRSRVARPQRSTGQETSS